MRTKGEQMLKYFTAHPTNTEVGFVLSMLGNSPDESAKPPAIMLMLLTHLKEPRNSLFLRADVSSYLINMKHFTSFVINSCNQILPPFLSIILLTLSVSSMLIIV